MAKPNKPTKPVPRSGCAEGRQVEEKGGLILSPHARVRQRDELLRLARLGR
jgi:hypothetical protein